MTQRYTVGVICPVFNEEDNIPVFISAFRDLEKALPNNVSLEYLFVDNASVDGTEEMLRQTASASQNIRYARYSRNFGVMKSIYTGMLISPAHWDGLAVYDCDLGTPALMLSFIDFWLGGHDVVYGKRQKRDEIFAQTMFRKIFKYAERKFHRAPRQIESGAWFVSAKVVMQIKKRRNFQEYLPAVIDNLGFKRKGVEYSRAKRKRGTTKFNFVSYLKYALDGLIVGSFLPLRMPIFVGLLFSTLSLILGLYFIFLKLFSGTEFPEGTVAIIVISLFANALNFLFLGVIGEYVGRILNQETYSSPAIIDYTVNGERLDKI